MNSVYSYHSIVRQLVYVADILVSHVFLMFFPWFHGYLSCAKYVIIYIHMIHDEPSVCY